VDKKTLVTLGFPITMMTLVQLQFRIFNKVVGVNLYHNRSDCSCYELTIKQCVYVYDNKTVISCR